MLQNTRNQQGDNQGNSGRGAESDARKWSEGFTGMNYEQVRQPYNPGNNSNRNREDITNNGEVKPRE